VRFLMGKRGAAAAVSLAVAVASAAATLAAARDEARRLAPVAVVAAARDLPPDTRLAPADVKLVRVAPDAVPPGALRAPGDTVGRVLAAPLGAGQFVLRGQLSAEPERRGLLPGEWPVFVPLRDLSAWGGLLRPGDRVNLVQVDAQGRPRVVASGLRLVALAGGPAEGAADGVRLGFGQSGEVAVLAAPAAQVPDIDAAIAARGTLVLHLDPWSRAGGESGGG
jgi:Flp pilus assembly protein CpaB